MRSTDPLQKAVDAFQTWRSNKKSSSARTPEHLRKMAIALTDHYPQNQIVRTLRLAGGTLKRWRGETQTQEAAAPTSFVPLPSEVMNGSAVRQIALDFEDGDTLTLSGSLTSSRLLKILQTVIHLPAEPGV